MTIHQATDLCIKAHAGQFRRVVRQPSKSTYEGALNTWDPQEQEYLVELPYHTHPIAVAELLTTDDEKIVALLHDIVEDTSATISNWSAEGYAIIFNDTKYLMPIHLVNSIQWLTKVKGESYEGYLRNLSRCNIATKVKLADMFHNMSDNPSAKQKEKYLKAIPILLNSI